MRSAGIVYTDNGAPRFDRLVKDFIMGEVRYNSLTKRFPERAEELFTEAEKLSRERYDHFKALEKSYEE